jgi:hypothetical protein
VVTDTEMSATSSPFLTRFRPSIVSTYIMFLICEYSSKIEREIEGESTSRILTFCQMFRAVTICINTFTKHFGRHFLEIKSSFDIKHYIMLQKVRLC